MNKTAVKILSVLFPNLVVKFAYDQITNPQIKKLRHHELAVLDTAVKEIFPFKGFDIQTYKWEGGADKVLLIHGWEGQAGNFTDLVLQLVANNFSVYAFDAPSHGFSSKGQSSLFVFIELVAVMIKKMGISKLVSHSFGGVATTYSLFSNKDLSISKYVLLTTPDSFLERIEDISAQIGITVNVKNKLINRLSKDTNFDISSLNVSSFVKAVNVEKALIIHDTNDTVIPIYRAKNVWKNWTACDFKEIEGTGHFRILRTESVINDTLNFLK